MDSKEDSYLTRNTLLIRAVDQQDESAWEEFVAYYRPFIRIILKYFGIASYPDAVTSAL